MLKWKHALINYSWQSKNVENFRESHATHESGGNRVRIRTGLRVRRLELITLWVAPQCDLSFFLWFSLLLLLLLALFYLFPQINQYGIFSQAQYMALSHFLKKILRNDPRRKESVAGCSKHRLQEVQFSTTWLKFPSLLYSVLQILWGCDRLTERLWVLAIYTNHSGRNLAHIHTFFFCCFAYLTYGIFVVLVAVAVVVALALYCCDPEILLPW